MTRNPNRSEQLVIDKIPVFYQRPHQTRIGLVIRTESFSGGFDGTMEQDRRAIIERMGQGSWRINPIETVILKS